MKDLQKNIKNYQVKTPNGFKDFSGVSFMGIKKVWRIETAAGIFLECTHDHKLFVNNDCRVPLCDLVIGDTILTTNGNDPITLIKDTGKTEPVYDLVEVQDGQRYYTNNILSSNCKFIIFDETLINATKLSQLEGMHPIEKSGQVRWYGKPRSDLTYVVSLDPSMGTGGDNAAIQVFELPTLNQIAEWQHNKSPIEQQLRVLKQISEEISKYGDPEIYWSVENNTLGEATLVVIRDTGEEHFPGTMLHDTSRTIGSKNKRKGFLTTNKTKLEACAKLKSLVESGKLGIRSKNLIGELKSFVSKGNSFEAKTGDKDDLVMATLLFVRMAIQITTWDDTAHASLNSSINEDGDYDDDDYAAPMPVGFL